MEKVQIKFNIPTNEESDGGILNLGSIKGSLSYNCVEYNRHFNGRGFFNKHQEPFPEDAVFYAELLDKDGRQVRHCSTNKKHDQNLFVTYPGLYYSDSYRRKDPDFQVLKDFGFAELLVKDLEDPYASFRDATIKCYYDDEKFDFFFCSASDKAHGAYVDDTIGFVDEKGEPFSSIPVGPYTIHVTLTTKDGEQLAEAFHDIQILKNRNVLVGRFDPIEHMYTMMQFSADHHVFFTPDALVGFIIPYFGGYVDGEYSGHLGLRSLFASQDLVKYMADEVYFFNYLMSPVSMSYTLEIPFLQSREFLKRKDCRFHAFYYEYGEPSLKGKKLPSHECKEGELMHLYRVDLVNEKAKENFFNLNEEALVEPILDRENIQIPVGATFAVTGVVNPYPRAKEEYTFHEDSNTFSFSADYKKLCYTITYGDREENEEREFLMVRYKDFPIGDSAYEFYNLFRAKPEMKDKMVTLHLEAYDGKDRKVQGAEKTLKIQVI